VNALDDLSRDRGEHRAVLALAWLLKHPSRIMPIVGSTDPRRIRDAVRATEIKLTREEWYALFVAARGEALP
jgi:predicted oxidoreductase